MPNMPQKLRTELHKVKKKKKKKENFYAASLFWFLPTTNYFLFIYTPKYKRKQNYPIQAILK